MPISIKVPVLRSSKERHLSKSFCRLAVTACFALALTPAAAHGAAAGINIHGGAVAGPMVPGAVATGAGTVRVFLLWQGEAALDPSVAAAYDGIVNDIVARGAKPVIVVTGKGSPPADNGRFAGFVGALAQRWVGKVVVWEIWNEPDEALWWGTAGGNPDEYAALLKAVYPRVHPFATVFFGPLTGNNFEFLDAVYKALGGGSGGAFDGVAIHTDTACSVVSPDTFQRTTDGRVGRFSFLGLIEVRKVMVSHGDDGKPIWMTELGWSTAGGLCQSGMFAGQKNAGVSEDEQARFLRMAWHCLKDFPYVANAQWFTLQDDPESGQYGLIRSDGSPKPSYAAFQDVAAGRDAFAGQSCGDFEPPKITVKSPDEGGRIGSGKALLIEANATDPNGVARITFLADGEKIRNFTGTAAAAYPTTRHAEIEWQGAKELKSGLHTIQVYALDGNGNSTTKDIRVVKGGSTPPPPVAGKTGGVQDVDGSVCFRKPGSKKCVPLKPGDTIPVGSQVNTTKGSVELIVADGTGGTYIGDFSGGVFMFTQTLKLVNGKLVANIKLIKGKSKKKFCKTADTRAVASVWPQWLAEASRRRVIRYLNAKASGRFKVIGNHASGIERGTVWKVTDTCKTTEVKAIFGTVIVRDFFKDKDIEIDAPDTYIAKPVSKKR